MKRFLLLVTLILLPLTVHADKDVSIIDMEGNQVNVKISDYDYTLMTNWNNEAPILGYPLVRVVPFKGTVGFEILEKAHYYPLHNARTGQVERIDLYVALNTKDTEVANYIQLIKKCTSNEIQISIKYSPSDPRSHR